MSRPSAELVDCFMDEQDNMWDILLAERTYQITYNDMPISIRVRYSTVSGYTKYKKTAYSNLGNCLKEVRHLNKKFNTTLFGYIEL